jgi:butyryl-CoA dehydrogenase
MTFRAPVAEIHAALRHAAGLDRLLADGLYGDLAPDLVEQVLLEAGKFASDIIGPINRLGDQTGLRFDKGEVAMPVSFKSAYNAWVGGGWNGLAAGETHGGQGLPQLVAAAVTEMMQGANLAFGLCPVLTAGAIEALEAHGSEDLKARYLDKLVSGEWTGTMNLTEPQAGSDLNALRARAERRADGSYGITGQKIFITYGQHDMADNIIHLVLARLPDAPPGTRGISLFLVPKILPDGRRNDVRCHSIEHKLGIHASPTCTMVFGDDGGATGWLIGEENRGLACMFTMMNNARLAVALQGVGLAERATQHAVAYAQERRQGRAPGETGPGMSAIIAHPDVRRMLMTMRAYTGAARGVCYLVAEALDRARRSPDEAERQAAHNRASLLTPVAKAFATDIANEVASLGVQVHGGMGFVEETGAAQLMRDARILAIYEGTNGIQAIDLVTRKLPLADGDTVRIQIATMRRTVQALAAVNNPAFGMTAARLREAIESLDRATTFMLGALRTAPADALSGAAPYARLFALAQGGVALADIALAAHTEANAGGTAASLKARMAVMRFFAEQLAPAAPGLEAAVQAGSAALDDAPVALAG